MKKFASLLAGMAFALPSLLLADSDPVIYESTAARPAICMPEPSLAGYVRCDMNGDSRCEARERSGRFTVGAPPGSPDVTDCNLIFVHPDPEEMGTWIAVPLKKWSAPDQGVHSGCRYNLPALAKDPILIRRLRCQSASMPTRVVAKYLNNQGDCK
jgi:hypothetical protein